VLARLLLVALGGGAGSALRWLVGVLLGPASAGAFPAATFAVNVSGCFAIGWLASAGGEPSLARLALGTGLLGGFTTFSAFSLEAVELARHGHGGTAALYAGTTLLAGFAAAALGLWLGTGGRAA
jgi:CrcB protein